MLIREERSLVGEATPEEIQRESLLPTQENIPSKRGSREHARDRSKSVPRAKKAEKRAINPAESSKDNCSD